MHKTSDFCLNKLAYLEVNICQGAHVRGNIASSTSSSQDVDIMINYATRLGRGYCKNIGSSSFTPLLGSVFIIINSRLMATSVITVMEL